ncbi:hypothetical protein C2845_PM04G07570 [Panicum miliaceum]|uniref:RRM domain-containing protein n=1 Tax=Panicum miliaceum TaxID=4540 RepID=A0A3L6QRU3_PANMI|nr:hypothetical protein C2845_PM04G07570 [Panicum miliaceum]
MAPGEFSATSVMHMIVRQLFTRLVFNLQFESSLSMEIISFWMWLEGIGHADFLASIDSLDNYRLHSIASAAKMFIKALRLRSIQQSNHRSMEGGYFRKEAVKGIVFYLNNVCYRVLEDILEVATAKENIYRRANQAQQQYVKGKATMTMSTKDLLSKIKASFTSARSHQEGSSSRSIVVPSPKAHILKDIENPIEQCLSSTDPLASLFEALNIREEEEEEEEEEPADAIQIQQQPSVPRDERTLFVTFSNGYPFTADELYEFFIGNFGDVEVISVQEPVAPKPPLYAHITFYTQDTLFRVLAGHPRVKFVIRGKHLWARKFVPKRKKAHNF